MLIVTCRKMKNAIPITIVWKQYIVTKRSAATNRYQILCCALFYVAFLYRGKLSKAGLHGWMHSAILYLSIQSESSISEYKLS